MEHASARERLQDYFSEKIPSFYDAVLNAGIRPERYAWPFLPYVGEAFQAGTGRGILFVGKATGAWSDRCDGYGNLKECMDRRITAAELLALTKWVVLERVLPHYANEHPKSPLSSLFWRRCYVLSIRTFRNDSRFECPRDATLARECFTGIAWTNLFKVGMEKGNPDSTMRQFLLRSFDTLGDEINLIRPDVVVFSTGRSYDAFLQDSSARVKVLEREDRVSKVSGLPPFVECAIRTPHFQSVPNNELSRIAELMARAG
jgi:hypothetical protein